MVIVKVIIIKVIIIIISTASPRTQSMRTIDGKYKIQNPSKPKNVLLSKISDSLKKSHIYQRNTGANTHGNTSFKEITRHLHFFFFWSSGSSPPLKASSKKKKKIARNQTPPPQILKQGDEWGGGEFAQLIKASCFSNNLMQKYENRGYHHGFIYHEDFIVDHVRGLLNIDTKLPSVIQGDTRRNEFIHLQRVVVYKGIPVDVNNNTRLIHVRLSPSTSRQCRHRRRSPHDCPHHVIFTARHHRAAASCSNGIKLDRIDTECSNSRTLLQQPTPPPDIKRAVSEQLVFFTSDLMVQQRRDYMATLRILSNRTSRPEVWVSSNKNKDGFFQADGFLTVLVDGGELGSPGAEVYQVFDWARVPGVTNLYTTDIPKYTSGSYWVQYFINFEVFVGGVSDGEVGVAVMPYKRPQRVVPISATKTWFFFDDVIVALGSGISLPAEDVTGESVITTIAQRLFRGSNFTVGTRSGSEVTISKDGSFEQAAVSWLHHDNIGYVVLGDEDQLLRTLAERRSNLDGEIHTFTAWLDHGEAPTSASHALVIIPAADVALTRDYAHNPDIDILRQDDQAHVVCHCQSQKVGIVFLNSGSVSINSCGGSSSWTLTVDVPCLALVSVKSIKKIDVTVTLSEPTQFLATINFQLQVEDGAMTDHTVQMPDPPHGGASVSTTITI
ncbi:unnamed protein product, partial [Meganyctiphanes norvegica]